MNTIVDEEKGRQWNGKQVLITTGSVRSSIFAFLSGADDNETDETAREDESAINRPSAVLERTGATAEFNKLASAQIEESRRVLNGHLDVLLTFSALFSGAISGVLGISWGLFSTASSSSSFGPSILVNRLITASLTCSLLASFGAVLGKQWLLSYGKITAQSSAGIQYQYQTWIDSARFWRLHGIVEGLIPMLLQAALILFIVGLIKLFGLVNPSISKVNEFIALGGLVAIGGSFLIAFWDPYCPYQTPITRTILPWLFGMAWASVWLGVIPFILIVLPIGVIIQCSWQRMIRTESPHSFAAYCINKLEKAMDPLKLTELWIGYRFREWRRLGEEVVERLQSKPPSTSVNCGNTTAWLLETSQEHDILKIVVTSFLMTHDDAFIQAFFRRKAIRHARRRWELATSRLSTISMSDSTSTTHDYDVKQLGSSIPLYEGVILHAYFSTKDQNQPKEREDCVRKIIWRRMWTKYGGIIATSNDLGDVQPFLDAAYGAPAIEFLLRSTPVEFSSRSTPVEFSFRRFCFQLLRLASIQSTPPPHLIVYAFMAAKLARLSIPPTKTNMGGSSLEFEKNQYMALRRVYGSDEAVLLLENVTEAIVAYCDYLHSEPNPSPKYPLPPGVYTKLLSWATQDLLRRSIPPEQTPSLLLQAKPCMDAMYRFIFVFIIEKDGSTHREDKLWFKMAQKLCQKTRETGSFSRIESIDLIEGIILQLNGAFTGPSSKATPENPILEFWTSFKVIRLLTLCVMARKARVLHHQPAIIKLYRNLEVFFRRHEFSTDSNDEVKTFLSEFKGLDARFQVQCKAEEDLKHGAKSRGRMPCMVRDEQSWFDQKKEDAAGWPSAEKSLVLTTHGQVQRRLGIRRDALRQRISAGDHKQV